MTVTDIRSYRDVKHLKTAAVELSTIIDKINDTYGPASDAVADLSKMVSTLEESALSKFESDQMSVIRASVNQACASCVSRQHCIDILQELLDELDYTVTSAPI